MTLPAITSIQFGITPSGETVNEYTLKNSSGSFVKIINFGGIITQLQVPDKNGVLGDVVLGFETLEPYLETSPYFGAIIGRYGNRIANASFQLNGKNYQLAANNGTNNLHGGPIGFDKRVWQTETFTDAKGQGLKLHLLSQDGDQGFPANLQVTVTYQFTEKNELVVDYVATTDQTTLVNLTQHSYFNLADSGDILQHQMQIFADRIVDINDVQIPLGNLMPVENTPFDFRQPKAIGADINQSHAQITNGLGYDHTFVINQHHYKHMTLAARVSEPVSGRVLEVLTEEPGVQFYSGNFLDGSLIGKGTTYHHRTGFCLEPQHYPDSPNQPQFPTTVLNPGDEYKTKTIFRFLVTPS
ncbi:MAG: galactose mutarotase [Cellvibrio sp.]|nr:galactose mutarotase [Cellvibrio sp.]